MDTLTLERTSGYWICEDILPYLQDGWTLDGFPYCKTYGETIYFCQKIKKPAGDDVYSDYLLYDNKARDAVEKGIDDCVRHGYSIYSSLKEYNGHFYQAVVKK